MSGLEPQSAVVIDGLLFPEAPRWREGRLHFTDVLARQVCAVDSRGELEVLACMDEPPGGNGFDPEGSRLVVACESRRLMRLGPEGFVVHADLSSHSSSHLNDLVVDAHGRAYVGNYGFDLVAHAEEAPSQIFLVDTTGEVRQVADGLRMVNGMALTPGADELVAAESWGRRLTCFRVEDDGSLTQARTFAEFETGLPDGICMDAEGAVWMADPLGRRCLRVARGGEVLETLGFEGRRPFACALGGRDGRTLFLCTGRHVDPDKSRADRGGRIERLEVRVPGAGSP